MKVLHITPYMHNSAGGPPVVVKKLTELTPSLGWEASVVTTNLFCNSDESDLQTTLGRRFPIKVLRVNRPKYLGLCSDARSDLDTAIQKTDLVHIHTLWSPLTGVARRFCKKYGKPYIVMPHGMLDPYSLGVKSLKKRLYMIFIEKRNLLDAQRIVYTTSEEQNLARKSLPWLPKSVIVPLGSELPPKVSRAYLAEKFFNQFPTARGKRRLLFLSRIHHKKGLDRLIDVFARILRFYSDAILIVAGSGDHRYIEKIKKDISAKGIEHAVFFTGMLRGEMKWGAYAAAEVFLLPSKQENFAIVVAEAMHMGVPIILSNKVNSWPYVSRANAGIILEETDMEMGLENAIRALLGDPDLAQKMGLRGRDLAKHELIWPNSARAVVACYNEVLREWMR